MTFKEGVKEASPINLHNIGKKTHVTVELGMLIRGVFIVAAAVMAYMNFMVRVDRLEATNRELQKNLVIADSLVRKDIRITIEALQKDITTRTEIMVAARETDLREVRTSLVTEVEALTAEIEATAGQVSLELENLKTLIVSVNSTTHAELRPAIKNVQNALDLQIESMNKRLGLIEGQMQEQVKRSLWKFGKK